MILEEVDEVYMSGIRPDLEKVIRKFMSDTYGKKALNKEIRFSLMVRHEERKND